ncbi:hypothetical protein [Leptospira mtsangambouensis]|uniref:hypothetical protein n=1 Tax=Leptospira mtsangambouensis TaxID=2484912 RepID=UPI001EEBCB91|nr:hypothetical protein [Leptospira mtsangambouensis]MCG6142669.1 hypothetical protein [Leptospira mtsangambouensis]
MALDYLSISLYIASPNSSVEELGKLLNCYITNFHEKGTPIYHKNPRVVYEENIVIIDRKLPGDAPLSDLKEAVAFFSPLVNRLLNSGISYNGEIFIGVESDNGQGEIILESFLLKEITELNLDLRFDILLS